MKSSELKTKSTEELSRLLSDTRGKLFSLGFQAPDKKVKDSSQAKKTRKDIARILTFLRDKKS